MDGADLAEPAATRAPSRALVGAAPLGLTLGLLLAVTLGALEQLTVLSVMPLVVGDLDGLSLYGWVFGGFFLTSALAIPIAAQVVDRSGMRAPFAVGLALFGGGLLVAGFAPTMFVLVVGRFLQGTGAGTISAVTYAAIALAYGPRERARMLALVSTAWLVPAFVGPLLGSAIAHVAGWRWTFLGLAAFVPITAALVLPALGRHDRRSDRRIALSGSWTQTLLPPREIGLAAVLSMLAGSAIYGVLSFAPLGITEVRGEDTFASGISVGVCSVTWILGSWYHQRVADRVDLRHSIRLGLAFVTLVSPLLIGSILPGVPFFVILVGWALVGLGSGVAFQAINLFVMGRAAPGTEGRATSSVQLANTIGAAVGTTALGLLFNAGRDGGLEMASSLLLVFGACWIVVVVATLLAWTPPSRRDTQAGTTPA